MMYKQGDVILTPFPFTDATSASKQRPAIIISKDAINSPNYIAVMVTSVIRNDQFSFPLFKRDIDFVLDKPSEIRTNIIMTIDNKLIVKKIGNISPDGLIRLTEVIRDNF